MKTFNEKVEIYNKSLYEAKLKLPNPVFFPYQRIQIPVYLEKSITSKLTDFEISPTTYNPSILIFEFEKDIYNQWVLI